MLPCAVVRYIIPCAVEIICLAWHAAVEQLNQYNQKIFATNCYKYGFPLRKYNVISTIPAIWPMGSLTSLAVLNRAYITVTLPLLNEGQTHVINCYISRAHCSHDWENFSDQNRRLIALPPYDNTESAWPFLWTVTNVQCACMPTIPGGCGYNTSTFKWYQHRQDRIPYRSILVRQLPSPCQFSPGQNSC